MRWVILGDDQLFSCSVRPPHCCLEPATNLFTLLQSDLWNRFWGLYYQGALLSLPPPLLRLLHTLTMLRLSGRRYHHPLHFPLLSFIYCTVLELWKKWNVTTQNSSFYISTIDRQRVNYKVLLLCSETVLLSIIRVCMGLSVQAATACSSFTIFWTLSVYFLLIQR